MYAVVRAGGAYVPIDPDHPADRIAYILDTAAPVVRAHHRARRVADSARRRPSIDAGSPTRPVRRLRPTPVTDAERHRAAASRSTPRTSSSPPAPPVAPRASPSPHAAIVNQLAWMQRRVRPRPPTTWCCRRPRPPSTCRCGSCSVAAELRRRRWSSPRPDGHRDPAYLAERHRPRTASRSLHFVPSMLDGLSLQPSRRRAAPVSLRARCSPSVRRCPPRPPTRLRAS